MARRRSKTLANHPDLFDFAEFDSKTSEIDEEISALKKLPEKLKEQKLQRELTLPPPEHLAELERRRRFEEQATRGQIRNERRAQNRSILLMILLLTAIISVIFWIITLAKG